MNSKPRSPPTTRYPLPTTRMHREPLLKLLDAYEARHPNERPMVARIRKLVTQRVECFQRDCLPGHITGSAWILSSDRSQHLLVHHRKLDRWLQPGGHADGETDVAEVALREAIEETGLQSLRFVGNDSMLVQRGCGVLPLDVDVHQIPERRTAAGDLIDPAHEHHDVRFLFVAAPCEAIRISNESHDVRWFAAEEIALLPTDESVLRMLRKVTARAITGQDSPENL